VSAAAAKRMTLAEYREAEGANWTTIKVLGDSPLHYQHALAVDRKVTPALLAGLAGHTATLDPDNFMRHYVLCDLPARRGNKWKEFQDAHPNKTILFEADYANALAIRDAVQRHPVARALLAACPERELPVFWPDPDTGIRCKARLDALGPGIITELKTTKSLIPRTWQQQAARLMYHGQMAMQRDGIMSTRGDASDCYIIAVESSMPHDVGVFRYGPDEIEKGLELYQGFLRTLKTCRERNEWPGRYPDEQHLELPAWVYGDDELGELTATVVGEAQGEAF
jgi:exodeoxyribonuclease VIII